MNSNQVFITNSPEETLALGERLGGTLKKGAIVALNGALGAGKTYLTKGIAQALGVEETVTSPTYTIVSEYKGRALPFYHIDTYRLAGEEDFIAVGGEECISGEGVCVIEWAERAASFLPESAILIEIEILPDDRRRFTITGLVQEHGQFSLKASAKGG